MTRVTLTIDGKTVQAAEGSLLLWAALESGIYIPNLCALPERPIPFAGCRLCMVDIEGRPEPVAACTETVREGMVVATRSARVLRLQRSAFALILSAHHLECGLCGKNKRCALQQIAKHLKVPLKPGRLPLLQRELAPDDSHPLFRYDPNKCVLCGKCVWVCNEKVKAGILHFAHRGFETMVTTFGNGPLAQADCTQCLQCVEVCPVGALLAKTPAPQGGQHA